MRMVGPAKLGASWEKRILIKFRDILSKHLIYPSFESDATRYLNVSLVNLGEELLEKHHRQPGIELFSDH